MNSDDLRHAYRKACMVDIPENLEFRHLFKRLRSGRGSITPDQTSRMYALAELLLIENKVFL